MTQFIPYEYQELAIEHLRKHDRACLFMGCGLGKTATSLQRMAELIEEGYATGFLVVAPLRVCNLTWPAEVEEWEDFSWMKVANLRTDHGWRQLFRGSAHIYVINYEMLPKLAERYFYNRRQKDYAFQGVYFDELTRAKNHKSTRIKAVRPYIDKLKWVVGLTGTPAPNSLMELFGQLLLVDKGETFGKHITRFRQAYFHNTGYGKFQKWEATERAEEAVHEKLKKRCITLKTSDWLDLPDIEEEDIEIKLKPSARRLYEKLQKELIIMLERGTIEQETLDSIKQQYEEQVDEDFSFDFDGSHTITAATAAVLTMKLLQATSGCIYTTEEKKPVVIDDSKMKALEKLCKKYKGKSPIMIACWFKHEQERLRSLPGAKLFSDCKKDHEQKRLQDQWNAGKVPVLVVHPASVGHGINLQKGGHIGAWMTIPWSRELYDQTNARLHRKGQKNPVKIYRLLCEDSADLLVAESLRNKHRQQTNLLNALRKLKSK